MILLKPILKEPEFHFLVHREVITFVPRISVILADMAEADKLTNVYQPSSSKRLCASCLVSKDDLNNMDLVKTLSRTSHNMNEVIENDEAHNNSLHPESNIFWELRYKFIVCLFVNV